MFVVLTSHIGKYFIKIYDRNGTSIQEEYLLGLQAKVDTEELI